MDNGNEFLGEEGEKEYVKLLKKSFTKARDLRGWCTGVLGLCGKVLATRLLYEVMPRLPHASPRWSQSQSQPHARPSWALQPRWWRPT